MINLKIGIFTAAFLTFSLSFIGGPLLAAELRVVKISPHDARAVVRIGTDALQVIRVGQDLGDHGKVIEIAPGRVVLEAKSRTGTETVVIRVRNGRQSVERIRRSGEKGTVLQSTQSSQDGN